MRFSKKTLAIGIGTLLTVSVPMSAYALTAACTGATATTPTSNTVKIKDTAADNHSARSDYYIDEAAPARLNQIEATGGLNDYNTTPTLRAVVTQIRACTQNNNPFDTDLCSRWEPQLS